MGEIHLILYGFRISCKVFCPDKIGVQVGIKIGPQIPEGPFLKNRVKNNHVVRKDFGSGSRSIYRTLIHFGLGPFIYLPHNLFDYEV